MYLKTRLLVDVLLSELVGSFALLTIQIVALAETGKNPGWGRICGLSGDQQVYQDIYTNMCPAGAWFNSDKVQWSCLCMKGIFMVRFGWCSAELEIPGLGESGYSRFTSGPLTCIKLSASDLMAPTLEGILNLASSSDGTQEGAPMLWTKEYGGTLLKERDLCYANRANIYLRPNITTMYALRVLPRPGVDFTISYKKSHNSRRISRAVCLRAPSQNLENKPGTVYAYKLDYLWSKNLITSGNFHNHHKDDETKFELEILQGCDLNDEMLTYEYVDGVSLDDFVIPASQSWNLDSECSTCMEIGGDPFDLPTTSQKSYPSDLDDTETLDRAIDVQSERIAHFWGKHIRKNYSVSYKSQSQEFTILQKAAIMAYGACDMNYVPIQFYQYFLLFLEALLATSFAKFPPSPPINPKLYANISRIIQLCMESTQPYNIGVSGFCEPQYDKYYVADIGNVPIDVPKEFLAIPGKHDYILEFAWKLISFLRYHCYDHFEDAPTLQELLQMQLENLFTDDLIIRWQNPSNSLAMLEQIFKIHFDVKTTMANFEKCISVANKANHFHEWLKKPINLPPKSLPTKNFRRRRDGRLKHSTSQELPTQSQHYSLNHSFASSRLRKHQLAMRQLNYPQHPPSFEETESKQEWSKPDDRFYQTSNLPFFIEPGDIPWIPEQDEHCKTSVGQDQEPVRRSGLQDLNTFRGSMGVACLSSISEFSQKNPAYSLFSADCWDTIIK